MAALKGFTRVLELDPTSAYVRYQLAAIQLALGLREDAVTRFHAILQQVKH